MFYMILMVVFPNGDQRVVPGIDQHFSSRTACMIEAAAAARGIVAYVDRGVYTCTYDGEPIASMKRRGVVHFTGAKR